LAASKLERLKEFYRRLRAAHPFCTLAAARSAVEAVMREVEDELSGIPENPDASVGQTDGRMYPPHDDFEIDTGTTEVRTFRHKARHRTSFGNNGAIQITGVDGILIIDLPGSDGRTVATLMKEAAEGKCK
jgi:hypothetical protein